jgi:N-acetyl-gamma-glutamyl-phosphate reductase
LVCDQFQLQKAGKLCDLLLLAVPHTAAMEIVPKLLDAGKKVIDFSADYRLQKAAEYTKWYKTEHKDVRHLKDAVYGLPELYRTEIKKAALIANPGCYPTAALLGLAPIAATLTKNLQTITIDAKSGVSGAGRKLNASLMFSEVQENFRAYRVLNHQHTPEIDQYLSQIAGKSLSVTFVPHLLPVNRGILETIYVHLNHKTSLAEITDLYKKFYKTEPFVRVLDAGTQPELKNVVGTNYCDIGLAVHETGNTVVITTAIDNLMKGAAGQAVQNMNIMCGFKETEGLLQ